MINEINKFNRNFLEIMKEDFKTISYSIAFLSDSFPKENVGTINLTEKDNIFKDIASVFALQLALEAYDKDNKLEIIENTKILFPEKEFETQDGALKIRFEQPFKLIIKYDTSKGNKEDPEAYIKGLANLIAVKSGKKSKIGSVGVNYEIFKAMNEPEKLIRDNLIIGTKDDELVEGALVKLVYKIDEFTKLNLSITSAINKEKKGLYLNTNFHSEIKSANKISDIFERSDFKKILDEKIAKLIRF